MTVGVLIITHDGIGEALLATASGVFPDHNLRVSTMGIARGVDTARSLRDALAAAEALDAGDGVLVLSDLYGSTPSNIAARVAVARNGRLVSGVNLPMLLRVINYPTLALDEMANKAIEGGRAGVVG